MSFTLILSLAQLALRIGRSFSQLSVIILLSEVGNAPIFDNLPTPTAIIPVSYSPPTPPTTPTPTPISPTTINMTTPLVYDSVDGITSTTVIDSLSLSNTSLAVSNNFVVQFEGSFAQSFPSHTRSSLFIVQAICF